MRGLPWLGLGACVVMVGLMACSSDDDGGSSGAAGSAGGTAGNAGTGGGSAGTGGSTAGTGGTAGAGSNCEGACEKITAQNCSAEPDQATCVTDCEQDIEGSSTCSSQGVAVTACVAASATVSCDEEGDAQFENCDNELSAWLSCSGCDADDDDTACDTCQKTQCCAEYKALVGDLDFFDLQACMDPCGDDEACMGDCGSTYPDATTKLFAFINCQETNCGTQCQ
jgi:hypothetical protein